MLVLLLYPIPEDPASPPQRNFYRHFLGRLHRPQDFQFIVDGMTRILNQPLQERASYLPGNHASVNFSPEIIMFFWELTQCNKRFRSFIIDTDRLHDFVVLTLFYALEYKTDASKQGVVRMCAFLLQTLSVEQNFGVNLNKAFTAQDTLPPSIRISGFHGTYADFLIHVRRKKPLPSQMFSLFHSLLWCRHSVTNYGLLSSPSTTSSRRAKEG
jgi:hypothetical protein